MKTNEARIAWEPGTDRVVVDTLEGGGRKWHLGYRFSGGACWSHIQEMKADSEQAKLQVYVDAISLILTYGVDPLAVYREFYKIDEFRDGLSEDSPTPDKLPDRWAYWKSRAAERPSF